MPLSEFLERFDRNSIRPQVEAAERQRAEILVRFPLAAWPTLPLDRYALGQEDSKETFCSWLEFRSQDLGSIRGGNARKLLIYKHKKEPGWYYYPEYPDEQRAWEDLRSAFVHAFELAREERWNEIDDLPPFFGGPALRLKTMYVYFPQDLLPISSGTHVVHFLRLLGHDGDPNEGRIRLNRSLLKVVRSVLQLASWTTKEIERLLYLWADPRIEQESRKILKVAPGEVALYWQDCLKGGYICLGWDALGDLTEFADDREGFLASFVDLYSQEYKGRLQLIRKKAEEVWSFYGLEPGDLVLANQGISKVLALGEVVEPGYEWRPERLEYRHTVRVKWDTSYATEIPPQKTWAFATVLAVAPDLYQNILRRQQGPRSGAPQTVVDKLLLEIAEALERKGQVVLYGPPGTGKTYNARRFAVWWLRREAGAEDAAAALADPATFAAVERNLEKEGVLTFLTFHASYAYEDFVEGFRPTADGASGLSLKLTDGIFKRICRTAAVQPKQRFLVLVDEINRAHVAKVFGELISLLERDKRGLQARLAQSGESFTIPPNVYLLATMNTADRSIKLLDAALRRRFAFIELMPDLTLLQGAKVQGLHLDDFLEELNRRIAEKVGRERQIGHSFLLDGGQPITEPEAFARCFRQEILPLLQEYFYDDPQELAALLWRRLVDGGDRVLAMAGLASTDELIAALEKEFSLAEKAG